MFYIILSKSRQFEEAADLISTECVKLGVKTSVLTLGGEGIDSIGGGDQLFFLTNEGCVPLMARQAIASGAKVLNSRYLNDGRTKMDVQLHLNEIGVPVPQVVARFGESRTDFVSVRFPLFVKTNGHVGKVFRVEDAVGLEKAVDDMADVGDWYAEEAVDGNGREMVKVYWVSGRSFGRNMSHLSGSRISDLMDDIGKEFGFDTFSADFFVGKDGIWCFDVNPAPTPAHFGSANARRALAKLIASIAAPGRGFYSIYQRAIEKRGGLKIFIERKIRRSTGQLIGRLSRRLQAGSQILEVGAGTGAISALLAKRGFRVTATDVDESMIAVIKESFAVMGVHGSVEHVDAMELSLWSGGRKFDVVISHGLLEHYGDGGICGMLSEQLAVAPLVVFVVPTTNMSDEYRWNGLGDERYMSTGQWLDILKRSGFRVEFVYGFGSKEAKDPRIPEILWCFGWLARFLAPRAAFNEFWVKRR